MLLSIGINNFKSIESLVLPLGQLTVLSGLNSSGKSSVIQAIRLLDRYNHDIAPVFPHELGDIRHLKSVATRPIELGSSRMDESGCKHESLFITGNSDALEIRDAGFPHSIYIGASRSGPLHIWPAVDSSSRLKDFGEHCELVYEFIDRYGSNLVEPEVVPDGGQGDTLAYAVTDWLRLISPGMELRLNSPDRRHGVITADFSGYSPVHVGYGLSYTLPVVVAALAFSAPEIARDFKSGAAGASGPILLVENPGAHLHPLGQTEIGKLIACSAGCGLQIVLETHSDHVIHGIRLAVKEGFLDAGQALVHFFSYDGHKSSIQSPKVRKNSDLEFWPEGFCDQGMINRARLLRD